MCILRQSITFETLSQRWIKFYALKMKSLPLQNRTDLHFNIYFLLSWWANVFGFSLSFTRKGQCATDCDRLSGAFNFTGYFREMGSRFPSPTKREFAFCSLPQRGNGNQAKHSKQQLDSRLCDKEKRYREPQFTVEILTWICMFFSKFYFFKKINAISFF